MPQVYGPSHGGKLTVQPDVSFFMARRYPVRSQTVVSLGSRPSANGALLKITSPGGSEAGVGTEVGHAPYAIAACKVQQRRFGIDPTEVVACEQAAAKGERAPVEIERGAWIRLLNVNRVSPEPVRLGQVRSLCTEPVRRPFRAPGQRHSASVTALFLGRTAAIGSSRAFGGRSATSWRPSSSP
jgi:hypothetical protein